MGHIFGCLSLVNWTTLIKSTLPSDQITISPYRHVLLAMYLVIKNTSKFTCMYTDKIEIWSLDILHFKVYCKSITLIEITRLDYNNFDKFKVIGWTFVIAIIISSRGVKNILNEPNWCLFDIFHLNYIINWQYLTDGSTLFMPNYCQPLILPRGWTNRFCPSIGTCLCIWHELWQ